MLSKLKQVLTGSFQLGADNLSANEPLSPMLAAAALMVEIISIDDSLHHSEKQLLHKLLQTQLGSDAEGIEQLIEQAGQAQRSATDFYCFTAEINRHYDVEQKIELIENLWLLAVADEELHQLEQHVIRRLANLLHVSHKDFIATKLRAMEG